MLSPQEGDRAFQAILKRLKKENTRIWGIDGGGGHIRKNSAGGPPPGRCTSLLRSVFLAEAIFTGGKRAARNKKAKYLT